MSLKQLFYLSPLDSLRKFLPSSSPSSSSLLLASSAVLLILLSAHAPTTEARSVAMPAPQCHPAVVQTMKPRIRQICKALEAIWEFSDVMENYLDEKGEFWFPVRNDDRKRNKQPSTY